MIQPQFYGLVANPTKPGAATLARSVAERMRALGWTALAPEETANMLGPPSSSFSVATAPFSRRHARLGHASAR
jgi:hypothetical protein